MNKLLVFLTLSLTLSFGQAGFAEDFGVLKLQDEPEEKVKKEVMQQASEEKKEVKKPKSDAERKEILIKSKESLKKKLKALDSKIEASQDDEVTKKLQQEKQKTLEIIKKINDNIRKINEKGGNKGKPAMVVANNKKAASPAKKMAPKQAPKPQPKKDMVKKSKLQTLKDRVSATEKRMSDINKAIKLEEARIIYTKKNKSGAEKKELLKKYSFKKEELEAKYETQEDALKSINKELKAEEKRLKKIKRARERAKHSSVKKFTRGVEGFVTAPVEYANQFAVARESNNFTTSFATGVFYGTGMTAKRMINGIYDAFTFPFRTNDGKLFLEDSYETSLDLYQNTQNEEKIWM